MKVHENSPKNRVQFTFLEKNGLKPTVGLDFSLPPSNSTFFAAATTDLSNKLKASVATKLLKNGQESYFI
jgi:hypothetical protein